MFILNGIRTSFVTELNEFVNV